MIMRFSPEGGQPVTIADKFQFRATAPSPGKIDVVYIPTATPLGILYRMHLVDTIDGADSQLTREQAAQLLMALQYACQTGE